MARQRRHTPGKRVVRYPRDLFQNPYPYMSDPEAMVKLELDRLGVPYSWRYFDGGSNAPTVLSVIPDFAPEFTLREYKAVIIVVGGWFGTLPDIIDKNALAQVALEIDGWKVAVLLDADIRRGPRDAIIKELPELKAPTITGPERPNPINAEGIFKERLEKLRATIRGIGLHRARYAHTQDTGTRRKQRAYIVSRSHRRRRRGNPASESYPELRRKYGGGSGPA